MTRSDALRYQQELDGRVETWARLMNNARIDSLLAMYEQSPTLVVMRGNGSRSRGIDQEEEQLRAFYRDIQYMNFVMQSPTTELLSADVALTTFGHTTDVVGADNRRRPVVAGRGTIVWMRDAEEDVWKIHLLHISTNERSAN
jgi:hypothetical protein